MIPGSIWCVFHKMFTIVGAAERLPFLHPAGHFGCLGNGGDPEKSTAFHEQNTQKRLTVNGKSCKMETRKTACRMRVVVMVWEKNFSMIIKWNGGCIMKKSWILVPRSVWYQLWLRILKTICCGKKSLYGFYSALALPWFSGWGLCILIMKIDGFGDLC